MPPKRITQHSAANRINSDESSNLSVRSITTKRNFINNLKEHQANITQISSKRPRKQTVRFETDSMKLDGWPQNNDSRFKNSMNSGLNTSTGIEDEVQHINSNEEEIIL